jgi:hypothetical protein
MPAVSLSGGTFAITPGPATVTGYTGRLSLAATASVPVSGGPVALTAGAFPIVPITFTSITYYDPITALLTDLNCPALPIYPPTGDRWQGARVYP